MDERTGNHVIICGFGRFAQAVLKYLGTTPPPIVFVELDPELEAQLREVGHPYVLGSTRYPLVGAGATEAVDPYRLAAHAIVRDLAGVPKVS